MKKPIGLKILSYCFLFFILMTILSPSIEANPIPSHIPMDGRSGGDPLPKPIKNVNTSVYLKEEIIKAKLYEDHACIEAEYTFYSEDSINDEIEICLPFVNDPWDVEVYCNDNILSYSGYLLNYCPIDNRSIFFEYPNELLSCIIFKIPVSYNSTTNVLVNYKSVVSKYDNYYNTEVRYYFSYLVGTARYWNHTIDRAHFEFRISDDLYDSEKIIRWNRTKKGDEYIFTLTYYNWTPTKDFVSFSWERDRNYFENLKRHIELEWRQEETRVFVYSCCGISLLIIIQLIVIIYAIRKKKRKRSDNR